MRTPTVVCLLACATCAHAKEDIEFVAEHLPEAAMDNRYATLPVWTATPTTADRGWKVAAQGALGRTTSGALEISGPLLSIAASRPLSSRWAVTALAFADLQSFSGGDQRDLQTLFAPSTPVERPVAASFESLDGDMRHYGTGLAFSMASDGGVLGAHRWVAGLLFEEIRLHDYGWNFTILEGESAGTQGRIDFDNDYRHITPFAGLQTEYERGDWMFSPHALFAVPLPRRGWVGHIATEEFDLRGDTADVGAGKHFGDPSVTFGLDITYRPAHLSFDVGALLTQGLLEPLIHKGIDSNWVLSVRWQH